MTGQEKGAIVFALVPDPLYEGCWYDDSIVWLDERPMPSEQEIQDEYDRQQGESTLESNVDNILNQFDLDSNEPVECTVTEGVYIINGGIDSILALDGAYRLAEFLEETSIDIVDIAHNVISLSNASIKSIAAQVAVSYRTAFFTKENALKALM